MKEVRLAFYKAQMESWTDLIISTWTWIFNPFTKPYSHVEIGFLIDDKWRYFSSSVRDKGTRWKDGDELLKNKDRWDIYSNEYPDEAVERMIDRAKALEGKKYDFLGIMGFGTITGMVFNRADWWYCSEACWKVLTAIWKKRISPRRFSGRIIGIFKII